MYYTVQIRKHNSKVIEPIEISQDIIPWVKLITLSEEPRIDLMEHKNDLLDYLTGSRVAGADLIVKLLKHCDKIELVRH